MTEKIKRCSKCGSLGPFHKQAGTADGLTSQCKECRNARPRKVGRGNKSAMDLVGNRYGKLIVIDRASPGKNGPRFLCQCDCGGQVIADGYTLRRGKRNSCNCLWRRATKSAAKATKSAAKATKSAAGVRVKQGPNKRSSDYLRCRHNVERARAFGSRGRFNEDEWRALCRQYGDVCLCCGEQKPLTADHVIPLSEGGTNTIDNIQPLCRSCNSRKGSSTIDYRNGASSDRPKQMSLFHDHG